MDARNGKLNMKTPEQLQKLEEAFELDPWFRGERDKLAESLGLSKQQVNIWFYHQRLKDEKDMQITKTKSEGSSFCSSSGDFVKSKSVKFSRLKSTVGSGSSSSSESDSSQSNEPLEAANTPGKIASQHPHPQNISPTEIESRIEKEVTARVEKEVKSRVASHVDSLRVEMDEKLQAMNVNLKKDVFESCRQNLMDEDRCVGNGGGNGGVGGNDGGGGGGGDGDLKDKMINMLTERNKRDRAKYESLLNEIACLGKAIEATDKLINDIKEVC